MQEKARKSLTDQLVHNTVRVECRDETGSRSVGTAFFFGFLREEQRPVQALVTNKHVVEGTISGAFDLTLRRPDGSPDIGNHRRLQLSDFADQWIFHPDPEVDLCILPITPLFNAAREQGFDFAYSVFEKDLIPSAETLNALAAVEDVLMIGYPTGIWDSANNIPVVRKGITATPPRINYQGRREFMIDIACFPGSSGSPVILLNEGSFLDHIRSGMVIGNRLILLGILYAGPMFTANGEIVRVEIPTRVEQAARTGIPMNLGMVIRSESLLDFEQPLRRLLDQSSNT